MNYSPEEFSEYFKKTRIKNGYKSQRKLADTTGISSATLSRIEAGLQRPQLDTLKIISDHFKKTTYDELLYHAGYDLRPVIMDFTSDGPAYRLLTYEEYNQHIKDLEDDDLKKKQLELTEFLQKTGITYKGKRLGPSDIEKILSMIDLLIT